MTELSRATDVAGVRARLANFTTPESRARGLALKALPTDVFISTYPKCGTTLLQQIVHGLRTRGDMDFKEITEVVPWPEIALDIGIDAYGPQKAHPRAFKSHLDYHQTPKGARYIYVLRDPADMVVSFYHFFSGWIFEPGSIDLETFANEFVLNGTASGRYWEHLVSWWPKRAEADTLILCFEDVTRSLRATVERVAEFIGVDADEACLAIATHQATIEFMKAHESQFDDNLLRTARNAPIGLPADAYNTKVRSGKSGSNKGMLSDALRSGMAALWAEIVEPATGHPDYASLRTEVARLSGVRT